MLNKRHFEATIDIRAVDQPPVYLGAVKQLDGTMITIHPLNNEVPMNLEGCSAKLYVQKPNEVFVYQEDSVEIDTEESKIVIQCKNSAFSQVGKTLLEVEIYDDDLYISTTPTFEINVVEKLNQLAPEDIEEAPEIDMFARLKKYVEDTRQYIDKFKDLLAELGEDDNTMLENLLVVRAMMESIDEEIERLESEIEKAKGVELEINNNEEAREVAEAERQRKIAEFNRIVEESNAIVKANEEKMNLVKNITAEEIDRILEGIIPEHPANKVSNYYSKDQINGMLKNVLKTTNVAGSTLNLTKDRYQVSSLSNSNTIALPSVAEFTEIHLYFKSESSLSLKLPSTCKWQNKNTPTFEEGKIYELIFTYLNPVLGWIGQCKFYE